MNNDELIRQMRKIKNNLNSIKNNLRSAEECLNDSITINNSTFQKVVFSNVKAKADAQINNLNNKIIRKLNSM